MEFPVQLFPDEMDCRLARSAAEALDDAPLFLTDTLGNSFHLNARAEALLGEPAGALVNRAAWSLLGLGSRDHLPAGLAEALLGTAGPWRGIVRLAGPGGERPVFIEASAVLNRGHLVCGIVRFGQDGG